MQCGSVVKPCTARNSVQFSSVFYSCVQGRHSFASTEQYCTHCPPAPHTAGAGVAGSTGQTAQPGWGDKGRLRGRVSFFKLGQTVYIFNHEKARKKRHFYHYFKKQQKNYKIFPYSWGEKEKKT